MTAPVALVTGGSGGIAPAIAQALAQAGHAIVLTARRLAPLEDSARRLADSVPVTVVALPSDALDRASLAALVAEIDRRFGRIDVLVNAAASSTPIGGAIEDADIDALIADVDTKVGGYLRYIQAAVPVMKRQGRGAIVNIGGLTGRSSDTLSGLRNAGVAHLTKVLADQLGPSGITVNAVHPGIVRSPHLTELFADMATEQGTTSDAVEQDFLERIPTRRLLDAREIGEAVAFLCGAGAVSITGESISVDGGYSRGIYL